MLRGAGLTPLPQSAASAGGAHSNDSPDCSIVATKIPGVLLVSTTDFFYPLVDDPYTQGRIACANVLSDLYSLGLEQCDTMLMLLAASTEIPQEIRYNVTEQMMRGFVDVARDAGTSVTGGQSVRNPWPIIGGVASTICREEDIIRPIHGVPGDVVVLTKPCGTQLAVNAHQWLNERRLAEKVPRLIEAHGGVVASVETLVRQLQARAIEQMSRLNRVAARAMRTHGAHGATDVTGFGFMGHANNLAKSQRANVRLRLDRIPVLRHTPAIAAENPNFALSKGTTAETSGGLLVLLPPVSVDAFIRDVSEAQRGAVWRVGELVAGAERDAYLAPDFALFEV